MTKTSLLAIERIARRKSFKAGELIFQEGDEAVAIYIVEKGSVDLILTSELGKEQLLRKVQKGEMFGEAVMFSGGFYPATSVAAKDSDLLMISKGDFLKLIGSHPEIAFCMLGTMSKLLRHLNSVIADLSLGSVASRLSKYLLNRAKNSQSNSFKLGVSKRELAFTLGTISETLSRNLRKLADEGIIEMKKDLIVIKKPEKLQG